MAPLARAVGIAAALVMGAALGACGDDAAGGNQNQNSNGHDAAVEPDGAVGPAARLIEGGGVTDAPVEGVLHVYVVDNDGVTPVAGAQVRIGEADAAAPLTASTDAAGLATFRDSTLLGPQVVTVAAPGWAAATWFGVAGANVTIPLGLSAPPVPETAEVSGTITGWDGLPAPAMGHYRVALVGYSHTANPQGPENSIAQPGGGGSLPPNTCLYAPPFSTDPCAWSLATRTGRLALYAVILDGDANATPTDTSDDTYTVLGYASRLGLDPSAGESLTGQDLTLVPDADLRDTTVTFPAALPGMEAVLGVPYLDLGEDGRIPWFLFDPQTGATPLPAVTGAFAGGHYLWIGLATPPGDAILPSSISLLSTGEPGDDIALPAWLPTPASLAGSAGTWSFTPAAEANLHLASLADPAGNALWNVVLLDGRTTIALPVLTPDPLPAGTLHLTVTAMEITGFAADDFSTRDLADAVTRTSSDAAYVAR